MGLPVDDVKMGLPVHDSFGWILAAGVSLWWLHNREVNLDVPSDLAAAPTNTSEMDPQRWPDGHQPLAVTQPNGEPIIDPVVQDLHDKIKEHEDRKSDCYWDKQAFYDNCYDDHVIPA